MGKHRRLSARQRRMLKSAVAIISPMKINKTAIVSYGEKSVATKYLNYLEKHGYGHTEAARLICESIANKAASSKSS